MEPLPRPMACYTISNKVIPILTKISQILPFSLLCLFTKFQEIQQKYTQSFLEGMLSKMKLVF